MPPVRFATGEDLGGASPPSDRAASALAVPSVEVMGELMPARSEGPHEGIAGVETPAAFQPSAHGDGQHGAIDAPAGVLLEGLSDRQRGAPQAPLEPMGDPAAPVELNRATPRRIDVGELNFRRIIPRSEPKREPTGWEEPKDPERRRMKRRRRRLPPEFYVGQVAGQVDAKTQAGAGRVQGVRFPSEREGRRPLIDRWVPLLFGVVLPLLGGLYAAVQFDFAESTAWRFWGSQSPKEHPDALAQRLEMTEREMNSRARETYEKIEDVVEAFFAAERWEEAREHLALDHVPEDSEALAFLKLFPREHFRGAVVRVMDHARIPRTERFIFTTHVQNGRHASGEPILTFAVAEEREVESPKLHALPLYQSWRKTLTEFLETSGAPLSRFYVRLKRGSEGSSISLPHDGSYVRLEIEDWLVAYPWIKEAYVREDSWAGARLLTTLTRNWTQAVVDLEWRRGGPAGDVFVHVAGVHSSNRGDFPR